MYPLIRLWLDLGVVLVQLSGPRPLSERVGERNLTKARHRGEIEEVRPEVAIVLEFKLSEWIFISLRERPRNFPPQPEL